MAAAVTLAAKSMIASRARGGNGVPTLDAPRTRAAGHRTATTTNASTTPKTRALARSTSIIHAG